MTWVTTTQVLDELRGSTDATAWQKFQECFYPVVVGFARRIGLSATDAEDAAQETMLVFVKGLREGHYVRDQGRLSHWLFGVARRVILDFRKRLSPGLLVADKSTGTSFWNMVEDEKAVKHTWTTEWRRMVLKKCLDQVRREVDPKTFEAFELYALKETAVAEVAIRLNMSRNAVYIAKSRVLTRLGELEKEFEGNTSGLAT